MTPLFKYRRMNLKLLFEDIFSERNLLNTKREKKNPNQKAFSIVIKICSIKNMITCTYMYNAYVILNGDIYFSIKLTHTSTYTYKA